MIDWFVGGFGEAAIGVAVSMFVIGIMILLMDE